MKKVSKNSNWKSALKRIAFIMLISAITYFIINLVMIFLVAKGLKNFD